MPLVASEETLRGESRTTDRVVGLVPKPIVVKLTIWRLNASSASRHAERWDGEVGIPRDLIRKSQGTTFRGQPTNGKGHVGYSILEIPVRIGSELYFNGVVADIDQLDIHGGDIRLRRRLACRPRESRDQW